MPEIYSIMVLWYNVILFGFYGHRKLKNRKSCMQTQFFPNKVLLILFRLN